MRGADCVFAVLAVTDVTLFFTWVPGPSGEDVEGPAPPGGESRGGDDGDPEPEWPSGGGDSGGGGSGGAEAEEEQEEEEESDSGLDQYKLT